MVKLWCCAGGNLFQTPNANFTDVVLINTIKPNNLRADLIRVSQLICDMHRYKVYFETRLLLKCI